MTLVEPFRAARQSPQPFHKDLPLAPGNVFRRMLTAKALASIWKIHPLAIAEDLWPSDRVVAQILERGATAPAMTGVAGWAAELAQRVVTDTLEALGGVSAGAQLLEQGLVLSFDGANILGVPGMVADANSASWVAEGDPIPVYQFPTTGKTLQPYKLGAIAVLTREMVESSNAEALIGDTLVRSAGLALDKALFDSNPATAARPAGLRNGIAATASSNNADTYAAFFEDMSKLINVVSAVGGNGPYVLVGSPGRAEQIGIRVRGENTNRVLISSQIADTDLIAVAAAAVAAAFSPTPDIEMAKAATLVMDTAPGVAGASGPERSMFQIDALALKMRWPISWVLRDPRGIAWMSPTWK